MSTAALPVPHVGVGVGVFIVHRPADGTKPRILIGKRKGSHGAGTWQLPGGHLEFGESFEECASREALEETNLRIERVRFCTATNDVMTDEGKHYVTVFTQGEIPDGEVDRLQVMEPHKCEVWEWASWEEIRDSDSKYRPLFSPLLNFIHTRKMAWPS